MLMRFKFQYDKHHMYKVSPLVKSHQNTHSSVKYDILINQYLHSILNIGEHPDLDRTGSVCNGNLLLDLMG